jgi:hypothetical protein
MTTNYNQQNVEPPLFHITEIPVFSNVEQLIIHKLGRECDDIVVLRDNRNSPTPPIFATNRQTMLELAKMINEVLGGN